MGLNLTGLVINGLSLYDDLTNEWSVAYLTLLEGASGPSGGSQQTPKGHAVIECREQHTDNQFHAPEGSLETAVAHIQADILGVDRVGRTDSFYDFGGTSLQAIRICARIEREIGSRALPAWLFETDVLTDFVKRLETEGQQVAD